MSVEQCRGDNAEGIGVLAVHDDRHIFGVNGHNYSHLVKILDGAGPSLHSTFARSDDLYYQWAGFDPRSAEYLQHIALALACQELRELVRVTDRPQVQLMISDPFWLAAAAGESTLLMELKADPNDAADAWVLRSLHGLMDLPAYRATALGRAAAKYVHDRLMQLPVAQTLDFMWYQALASVSALRTFRASGAPSLGVMQFQPGAVCTIACILGWTFIRSTLLRKCRGASTSMARAVVPTASSLMAPRSVGSYAAGFTRR